MVVWKTASRSGTFVPGFDFGDIENVDLTRN